MVDVVLSCSAVVAVKRGKFGPYSSAVDWFCCWVWFALRFLLIYSWRRISACVFDTVSSIYRCCTFRGPDSTVIFLEARLTKPLTGDELQQALESHFSCSVKASKKDA
jgi:hypothetical protein